MIGTRCWRSGLFVDSHQHHIEGRAVFAGCGVRAVGTKELSVAAGKSEFGVCDVVGGMMVIELLAGAMRRGRGGIAVVEDDMMQTYIDSFGL